MVTQTSELAAVESSTQGNYTSPDTKVAYIVSRFPKLTETFILYEIVAMEQELGIKVEIYPLLRQRERVVNPQARALIKRAHFEPLLSWRILRTNVHYLLKRPRAYFKTLSTVVRATFGSANFFLGAAAFFPKSVCFARDMEQRGINHVHAQFANHPALAGYIVTQLTGIPYSFTARGSDIHLERRMLKEKVEAAAFAITVSDYNRNLIITECGKQVGGKIHVVYGGVDTERVSPAPRAGSKKFTMLSIGRFEEVKGHTYLIEACRILRDRGIECRCHFIGEGPLFSNVREQIDRAKLGDHILISSFCTHDEVIDRMRNSDLVVLATAPTAGGECEGIPNVLKEAMACGLPVVASDAGGIPELVENRVSGILVPPRDPIALADAIQELAADPSMRGRMGEAGRQKILRDFNLTASNRRRAGLYRTHSALLHSRCPQRPESLIHERNPNTN
jgi:colanic acid/amylovoran biosynthesis glycosyltransferase